MWMDAVQSDLRNMVVKKMESKSFGQNRMPVCHEGSQGQTSRAIFLKKKEGGLAFCGTLLCFLTLSMFVILFIFDVHSRQVSSKKCSSTYKTAYATACKQI